MQKFIAKYGLAAHLAILAVAPLFLFPFFDNGVIVRVVLWLSFAATFWMLLEPSIFGAEHLTDARRRVFNRIGHDPLLWALLAILVLVLVRALNGGIALIYNAELSAWRVGNAIFPILPGSVGASGWLPFAAVLASAILILSCRHSLGRSARQCFLLLSSSLAGLSAIISHLVVRFSASCPGVISDGIAQSFSSVGLVYGVYLLVGTVSLVVALENEWRRTLMFSVLAVSGCAAGLFSFSPAYVALPFACAEVILLLYCVVFVKGLFKASDMVKMLVLAVLSLALAGLLAAVILPEKVLTARLEAFSAWPFFPENFWAVRATLSHMAFKSWIARLWIGTGIGSFPFDFRFHAVAENWVQMPMGAIAVPNGWWHLLAERGIVGLVTFLLVPGFLLATYGRRLVESFPRWRMPHPACLLAPLPVVLLGLVSFVDCSPMRAEVLMASGSVLAIAAASFPKRK